MNTDSSEWLAAEVLADPEEAFVLWIIYSKTCENTYQFYRHYGLGLPFWRIIKSLISKGLVRKENGRLHLNPIGVQAMTQLGAPPPVFSTQTMASTSHNTPSFARFSLRLLILSFGFLGWILLIPHASGYDLHKEYEYYLVTGEYAPNIDSRRI